MQMSNTVAQWRDPRVERRQHHRRAPLELVAVSFAGQNGGLLLDLSQSGASVQAVRPLSPGSECSVRFELPKSGPAIETTGQVAWADPNGRAGLRLALPPENLQQVQHWLDAQNAPDQVVVDPPRTSPPVWTPDDAETWTVQPAVRHAEEPPLQAAAVDGAAALAKLPALIAAQRLTLDAALQLICERTRMLTAATGAAVALKSEGGMVCRASSGLAPDVGVPLQMESGLSGWCVRSGEAIRCDDTENDQRVNPEACRALSLRSAVLVPLRGGQGDILGLLEVFSGRAHAFGDGELQTLQAAARLIVDAIEPRRAARSAAAAAPQAAPTAATPATPPQPETQTPELIPGLPVLGAVPRAAAPPSTPAPLPVTVPAQRAEREEPVAASSAPARTAERAEPIAAPAPAPPAATPARQPAAEPRRVALRQHPVPRYTAPSAMKQRLMVGAIVALALIAGALLYWWPGTTGAPAQGTVAPAPVAEEQAAVPQQEAAPDAPAQAAPQPQLGDTPPRPVPAPTPAAQRSAIPASAAQAQPPVITLPNVPLREPESAQQADSLPPPVVVITAGDDAPALDAITSLPATAPSLSAPVVVSQVVPARLMSRVQPSYPQGARTTGIQGVVVLDAIIGRNGSVREVRVVSGHPLLVQAAGDAVRRWRYSPSLLNGETAEATARITIEFKLPGR